MATTQAQDRPQLSPAIRAFLTRLRRRIRQYVWLEGLTAAAAWLAFALWASLAIDWYFEPSAVVRKLILAVVVFVLAGVLFRLIARRAFVHLSQSNMAMLLERRFGQLDDSLLTAVVLTGRPAGDAPTGHGDLTDPCDPQMLDRTCRQAAERIGGVRLGEVFNPAPLRWSVCSAVLLVASVALFAYHSPGLLNVWARRNLMFYDELWPRRVSLRVEGFEDGMEKVARGADFEVIALADTTKLVPSVVQVRYRDQRGTRHRPTMNRVGIARRGIDPLQRYSYTFEGVLAPIRFDVVGGDDRVSDLCIEVVESPTVVETMLDCRYPPYMDRAERTRPGTGAIEIPVGTQVTIRSVANKDLDHVQIDTLLGQRSLPPKILDSKDLGGDPRRFQCVVDFLDEDTTLLMTLSDTDGITGCDPVRLVLMAKADEPPRLAAQLDGIGPAITPLARLPVVGTVTDDYGIDRIWFEYSIQRNEKEAVEEPAVDAILSPPRHSTELKLDAAMEVGELKLASGQRLLLGVRAADRCDLGGQPNIGGSDRWLLEVVTPEDLLLRLQRREILLRQQFERILQEVTETRDLLLQIDYSAADAVPEADDAADAKGPDEKANAPNVNAPNADEGAEPADQPDGEPDSEPGGELDGEPDDELDGEPNGEGVRSGERRGAVRMLHLERALQNSRKNAHETEGVADAFDDIRKQTVNNRIDTPELRMRLEQGIADPLHQIAREMFPELRRRLEELEPLLADEELGPRYRDLARRQADDILLQMRTVLDRMIELESFNEVLQLLRTIIQLQEELGRQTQERQKQRVRELLED
ncbi:MAG: hypothetical protein A2V70_17085 [Planctomycetes bacterium RBG_13_63_9]|nr:MAG: hypothetical protein A2V70_17085 [Planctomycetes bacterium RBG_13_63_9]